MNTNGNAILSFIPMATSLRHWIVDMEVIWVEFLSNAILSFIPMATSASFELTSVAVPKSFSTKLR